MVSIIICCYNGRKFIDRCFHCIMAQSYKNIQIVFVDDGSSDKSFEEAEKYKIELNSLGIDLVLLQQENQGAGYATAFALKHVLGDFVMCLDVDDYIYPESVEAMVSFFESHVDYSVVRTNGYRVTHFNELSSAVLFAQNQEEKDNISIFEDLILGKTFNWAGAYMVRAKDLWRVYPNRNMLASRYGQNLQILATVAYQNKSGFIDKPLMQYIANASSFTNKDKSFERELELYDNYELIRTDILNFLNIGDFKLRNELKIKYLQLRLNLSIKFYRKDYFLKFYNILKRYNRIRVEDHLYKAVIEHNLVKRLFFTILLRLKNVIS